MKMDKRKLKHAPSLLRPQNSSFLTTNKSSTPVDDFTRAATSIRVRSYDEKKSPEIDQTESREPSPVLSRRSVSRLNATGSGTQLSQTQSYARSLTMMITGSKNQDLPQEPRLPDDETEDSDQDFLETTNRNIVMRRETTSTRPKRKRRSSDNIFSEDELPPAKKKSVKLSSEDDYLIESEMHRPGKHSLDDELKLAKKTKLRTSINLRKNSDTDCNIGVDSDVMKRDKLGQTPSGFFKKGTPLNIGKKRDEKNDSPEQIIEKLIDGENEKLLKSKSPYSVRDSIKNQLNILKKKKLETAPGRLNQDCSSERDSDTDSELHVVNAQKLRRSDIATRKITKTTPEMHESQDQMSEHSEIQINWKSLRSEQDLTKKQLGMSKITKFACPTSSKVNRSINQDSTDLELDIVELDKQMQSSFKLPENLKSPRKAKTILEKTKFPKGVSDQLLDSDRDMFNVVPISKKRTRKNTDLSPDKPNIRSDLEKKRSDSNIKFSKEVRSSFEKPSISNKSSYLRASSNPKDIRKSQRPAVPLSGGNVRRKVFEKYLYEAGIILIDDGENLLCDNQPMIVQKLDALISSNQYKKEEIIKLWQQHIEDIINLQRMLSSTKMANEQEEGISFNKECVARILLHVPSLQTEVGISLLDRLALAVLTEGSLHDVPWSGLLLRQFQFLDQIINPEALVDKVGELLEAAPMCFQREIISYLPDIVMDSQHHTVGEMLRRLMVSNSELMPVILNCISNLLLSADYLEELRDMAIDILKGNPQFSALPAITRFILTDCSTVHARIKAFMALRSVDMQPLASENVKECFTNQVLVVSALRMSILVSSQMADSAFIVQQRVKKDPKPLDLVMLLLIHSSSTKQKNVETLLKKRVRSGFYRASLLNSLYYDYKEVGRELQTVALSLASHLLKAGDRTYTDFAIEWFRLLFISQADAFYKQREILEKIILLMGVDTQTSKNALAILKKMASKEEEQEHLQKHCHHLRILLEKVDDFNLEEVATLSDLYGLCAGSKKTSDALHDDLDILLHKQLSSVKPLRKCKGVLGGVMALKHLVADSANKERVFQLFERVVTAVKGCSRSRSLFYDQMADVIANTQNVDESFLEYFTKHFTNELTQLYLIDLKGYSGNLVAEFSLNTTLELTADEAFAVTFEGQDGAAVPVLFKLIKVCCMRERDGDLSPIDALIGCPILISKNFHDPDSAALDQIFHCANWFREIISGFVDQSDPVVQEKLLKRLENLMTLQSKLSMNLMLADSHYQPPVCYFHHFPSPPFVKIESKSAKRGKKSNKSDKSSLFEWESWESGSALASKNPAYFRRLDAKIAHLLDFPMKVRLMQSTSNSITIAQVCFIIKELLGILDNEVSPVFMKNLVGSLPKVCSKLEQITTELREKDDNQKRECLRLLLHLLAAIFNWKAFRNAVYSAMLREALRVASQADESNTLLRSCKELVVQCCLYFESLSDVTTRISVAIALVTVFQSLILHSESLALQYKEKLAKTAFGFLCLDWPDDKSNLGIYHPAINTLLRCWIKNESDPLDTVITLLKWLPEEAAKLIKPQDTLARMLSINRSNFTLLLKEVFVGLSDGVKQSLATAKRDIDRIKVWQSLAVGIRSVVQISKALELKAIWSLFLRCTPPLLKLFVSSGMPVLEHNLKYHTEEVTGVVRQLQEGTKYLHVLCCRTKVSGDAGLVKYVPAAKSVLERLVFTVKGMMVLNNSPQAFWMGNLVNRNLKGQAINEESTEDSLASTSSILTDISEELLLNDSGQSTEYESE